MSVDCYHENDVDSLAFLFGCDRHHRLSLGLYPCHATILTAYQFLPNALERREFARFVLLLLRSYCQDSERRVSAPSVNQYWRLQWTAHGDARIDSGSTTFRSSKNLALSAVLAGTACATVLSIVAYLSPLRLTKLCRTAIHSLRSRPSAKPVPKVFQTLGRLQCLASRDLPVHVVLADLRQSGGLCVVRDILYCPFPSYLLTKDSLSDNVKRDLPHVCKLL
jgi:hypothetical protein